MAATSSTPLKKDYSIPSLSELDFLKSESLRLQHDKLVNSQLYEIYTHVCVPSDPRVEDYLRLLKEKIDSVPEQEVCVKEGDVVLGFPMKHSNGDGVFRYKKPSVYVTGSFLLDTLIVTRLNIDITLELPVSIFDTKDYLNYKYFEKRAAYLNVIANYLANCEELNSKVSVCFPFGAKSQPCLELTSTEHKYNIKIFCSLPEYFPINKLLPNLNCIRSSHREYQDSKPILDDSKNIDIDTPTPYYNMQLLSECYYRSHQARLYELTSLNANVSKVIVILKLWLYKLKLSSYQRIDGIPSHLLPLILSSLPITSSITSVQMLRLLWKWISEYNGKPQSLVTRSTTDLSIYEKFPVAIIDPVSDILNLTSSVSKAVFDELIFHSKRAFSELESGRVGFLSDKLAYFSNFDAILELPWLNAKNNYFDEYNICSKSLNRVRDLFSNAFGDRVSFLIPYPITFPSFEYTVTKISKKTKRNSTKVISNDISSSGTVTVNLVPENITLGIRYSSYAAVNRQQDLGPIANDKEAAKFRAFWGALSELRRFPDGSIKESVLWKTNKPMLEITEFILSKHFNGLNEYNFQDNQFCESIDFNLANHVSTQANFKSLFAGLQEKFYHLGNLPLTIKNVFCMHSGIFGASHLPTTVDLKSNKFAVFDNLINSLESFQETLPFRAEPVPILVEFESSNSWPDNLSAIARIKTAFYIKMAEVLNSSSCICVPSEQYIDLFYNGYIWRITIWCVKEMIQYEDTDPTYKLLEDQYVNLPRHIALMSQFQVKEPMFGPTSCIIKKWLSSHFFNLPNEVNDLFGLIPFTFPFPRVPKTISVAFYYWLYWMSGTGASINPQLAPIYNEFTSLLMKAIKLIDTKVLDKLSVYAKASLKGFETVVLSNNASFLSLFKTPLKSYDAFIILNDNVLLNLEDTEDKDEDEVEKDSNITEDGFKQPPKKQEVSVDTPDPLLLNRARNLIVGFDPIKLYLNDLKREFEFFCHFSYDPSHPKFIAVKFTNPTIDADGRSVAKSSHFSVIHSAHTKPIWEKVSFINCSFNISQVEMEFIRFGNGIVESVVFGYNNLKL